MINKQNLWFITLLSLIMVLSIYYLTITDDTLSNLNLENTLKEEESQVVISENETIVALKVASEEELVTKISELENILLNNSSSLEEKNKAYEDLQEINKNEASKETIEKKIKEEFKLDSYVSINGNNINITIASIKHDNSLANSIIRCVQDLFNENKYITVKFG